MEILTEVETIVTDVNRYRFDVCMITMDNEVLEGIASGTDAGGYNAVIRYPVLPDGTQPAPIVDLGDFGSLRAAKAALRRWAQRNEGAVEWIF